MNSRQAQKVLSSLFSKDSPIPCKITLWDGQEIYFGRGEPRFNLKITDPETFEAILTRPALSFGEAYVNGKVSIDGNLQDVLEWIYLNRA